MNGIARLGGIVLECRDPGALAEFYSRLMGLPILWSDPEWVTVGQSKDIRPWLSFQRAPDHEPPTWPDPASSMQSHLDFFVDDLDSAEAAAIVLGARKLDTQPSPHDFRVFADPAGHPFCLCK